MLRFLTFLSLLATVVGTCPKPTVPWQDKCYFLVTNMAQAFVSAEVGCINRGGHLASVHDGLTNVFIARRFLRYLKARQPYLGNG